MFALVDDPYFMQWVVRTRSQEQKTYIALVVNLTSTCASVWLNMKENVNDSFTSFKPEGFGYTHLHPVGCNHDRL